MCVVTYTKAIIPMMQWFTVNSTALSSSKFTVNHGILGILALS